ncbi:MAG: chemotaxis protein methyltransferase CheR [Alphaproteobacteria bacterium]|jgi:chemotaxis protein methyltransferase CheR
MKPQDIDLYSKVVKARSGLHLTPEKAYLLESRLLPVARDFGYDSVESLASSVRMFPKEPELEAITEAMTTNETLFFRDNGPFERFRDNILPPLMKARATHKRLRIWCAAASTGQEPYSLAMTLLEMGAAVAGWNIEIIGTDISKEALRKAQSGLYNQFEIQRGMPITLLIKYFDQEEQGWRIKKQIRDMVRYKPLNLMGDFSSLGRFDIVFCRNVLIYFERDIKAEVLGNVRKLMPTDGALFLGAAETVVGITGRIQTHQGIAGSLRAGLIASVLKSREKSHECEKISFNHTRRFRRDCIRGASI